MNYSGRPSSSRRPIPPYRARAKLQPHRRDAVRRSPTVGTGYVLAGLRPKAVDVLRFEEMPARRDPRRARRRGPPHRRESMLLTAPDPRYIAGRSHRTVHRPAPSDLRPPRIPRTAPASASIVTLVEVATAALSRALPDSRSISAWRKSISVPAIGSRSSCTPATAIASAPACSRRSQARWEDPATGSANATPRPCCSRSLAVTSPLRIHSGRRDGPADISASAPGAPPTASARASAAAACLSFAAQATLSERGLAELLPRHRMARR